jgi:hypothetical protein
MVEKREKEECRWLESSYLCGQRARPATSVHDDNKARLATPASPSGLCCSSEPLWPIACHNSAPLPFAASYAPHICPPDTLAVQLLHLPTLSTRLKAIATTVGATAMRAAQEPIEKFTTRQYPRSSCTWEGQEITTYIVVIRHTTADLHIVPTLGRLCSRHPSLRNHNTRLY